MIDLHLHTTASDGRLSPAELVERAADSGLTTIAVADHDTTNAIDEVTRLASLRGLRVVPGIEITAVDEGRDVHMLGYFIDHRHEPLLTFLALMRGHRVERIREIGRRLAAAGAAVDVDDLVRRAESQPGVSIGRPWLARALIDAGHVHSIAEAFERFLGPGQPAFVPRTGSSPAEVVEVIHEAGGIASFAHPGVTRRDWLLGDLAASGLDAIEAYHSDHTPELVDSYRRLAAHLGLARSGGSDFHGYGTRATLGVVHLPAEEFEGLESRVRGTRARAT